jgi:hypothetical protein
MGATVEGRKAQKGTKIWPQISLITRFSAVEKRRGLGYCGPQISQITRIFSRKNAQKAQVFNTTGVFGFVSLPQRPQGTKVILSGLVPRWQKAVEKRMGVGVFWGGGKFGHGFH